MTPDLSGIRLVSWDVDGTLYSLSALKRRILWNAFAKGWVSGLADVRYIREHVAKIEKERSAQGRMAEDERFDALLLAALGRLSPSKRALRMIAEIGARKIPQVVLSDHPATEKLKRLGIQQKFEAIYDCGTWNCWKPSPEPFRAIQLAHQVKPTEHLHIGDRLDSDEEGARSSGARFFQFKA
jgi:FMN phosphatase YigB (HAD superfamily)